MRSYIARKSLIHVAGPLLAILVSFSIGALLMLIIGVNPLKVYVKLFEGVILNPYGVAQIFFKATPLIFTGLSVALAFRAGLFNIGAEGQMTMGAFFAAFAGFSFSSLPTIVHVPLCLLSAFIGGMFWSAIPGFLKAKTGAHEVITTIMMNFIALALTNYFVTAHFHEPETVHTQSIASSAILPRLEILSSFFHGSPANFTFFIALIFCVLVWWLLWKMPLGYEMRAVGFNPFSTATYGIPVNKIFLLTFSIAGGLAGLAGSNFVMGYKHYFEEGFSGGAGFMGIAVALLGQNHPIGVVMASFLFGALSHGGLVINALVPKEIIEILQALVIIHVIIFNGLVQRWSRKFVSAEDLP